MSQPSRYLPLEIIDMVVENFSDDTRFLKEDLSIVDKSFNSQTQRYLFRDILLTIKDNEDAASNMKSFLKAKHIAPYVKNLTVRIINSVPQMENTVFFQDIKPYASCFTSIEKLFIEADHNIIVDWSTARLCQQFIHLLLPHDSVQQLSIHLHNISHFNYISLLPLSISLSALSLSGESTLSSSPSSDLPNSGSGRPPVEIPTLKFKPSPNLAPTMSSVLSCCGENPTIRLTNNSIIEIHDDMDSPMEFFFFWASTRASLQHIVIHIQGSQGINTSTVTASLADLQGLRTVEFYHCDANLRLLPLRAEPILRTLLPSNAGPGSVDNTALASITFTYDPAPPRDPTTDMTGQNPILFGNVSDESNWECVDRVLVELRQHGLPRPDGSSVIRIQLGRGMEFSNNFNANNFLPGTRSRGAEVRIEKI